MSDQPTELDVRLEALRLAFNTGPSNLHEIDQLVKYVMTGELPVEDCPPPIAERLAILETRFDNMSVPQQYASNGIRAPVPRF